MTLKERDKKYFGRGSSPKLQIRSSKADYIYDSNGKKYIDFVMGWCVGNRGWGVKDLRKAINGFKGPDYVIQSFLYEPWVELAELLAKITPGKLTKTFRATGGTEAVEFALQAAMLYTGRKKIVALEGSYHGNSLATMSVASSEYRDSFKNLLSGCEKIEAPLDRHAAKKVETMLKKRDIAAYISEPVVMNLDVEVPTREYFEIIQKACKKYGTLLIAGEVATGFGRTGKMFACEHYGLEPDILTMAKALSGGVGGIGACIMTTEVASVMEEGPGFWSTYGWHPLATSVAIANIKWLMKNEKAFLANASDMSAYFAERLSSMNFRKEPELRIKGLAIAVKFKGKDYPSKIVEEAQKNGLLITEGDGSINMFPAVNISKTAARQGLDILERCI